MTYNNWWLSTITACPSLGKSPVDLDSTSKLCIIKLVLRDSYYFCHRMCGHMSTCIFRDGNAEGQKSVGGNSLPEGEYIIVWIVYLSLYLRGGEKWWDEVDESGDLCQEKDNSCHLCDHLRKSARCDHACDDVNERICHPCHYFRIHYGLCCLFRSALQVQNWEQLCWRLWLKECLLLIYSLSAIIFLKHYDQLRSHSLLELSLQLHIWRVITTRLSL